MQQRRDATPVNERIRAASVRVIDDQNNQLGVISTREGVKIARSKGLDLIMVAAKADPPVCRIMDYGKYKYEKSKKERQAKRAASTELKMVRLHPRTGEHDRNVLIRNAERFLRAGHKVRVVCQFKGRENAHPQIGRDQLDAVGEALKEIANIEGRIAKQGREMTMFLVPKPGLKKQSKSAKPKADKADDDKDSTSPEDTSEDATEVNADEAPGTDAAEADTD